MIKDCKFDVVKELKAQACHPLLKRNNFKRKGVVWYRELPNNLLYIITTETRTIVKNDFVFSVHYGIYYKGVHEFLNEFPFELKNAIVYCIYKGHRDKKKSRRSWDSNDFTSFDEFKEKIESALNRDILPDLESVQTPTELLNLVINDIDLYIKNDSILALKVACLCYFLGQEREALQIANKVLEASKLPYPFAERLKNKIDLKIQSTD
ncbi:DUF4304 domain-containing protein [Flavihumibacter rivuli]|uniref:DUF4304 domain-containing protein n=1 Tax=Flavihumibacter rivuli TaxID=2838156 RepID=UPI001BDF1F69|nr:DUF4304 domain-containing protein [Flavihumibacter rivuli]ULQ57144.1 DUF4304 domain-containing protein [Flavihumibacter rivuli]